MAKFEPQDVEPRKYEVSRRRFLRNAGMVASVPFLGGLAEILGERGASAQTYRDESHPLFASHPAYKFTFVNHVTTNPFFTATQYGMQDAARILGIPTPQWAGSQVSAVSDMVNAIDVAIAGKVNGIATTLIDPTAFNKPVDRALDIGIPVIAYNADEPGNSRLCYVGQSNLTAGAAAAELIVATLKPGDLIGMVIATPGTGNIQPRINGALPIFTKAGMKTEVVAGGALVPAEITAVQAWWEGHKDVKFMYSVDNGDSEAVADCITKNHLKGTVGGSGWDVSLPVLDGVKSGALMFSIDQQAYLQGFVPVIQLFLYNISAGLMKPCDTDSGLGFINKANVGPYLAHSTRFEGATTTETVYTPPNKILHS